MPENLSTNFSGEVYGVNSLLLEKQCFITWFGLVSTLPIKSLTKHNFEFKLVFHLPLVAKIGIGIVLELHGIALQIPENCIGILLPK
jgi:hypothetical protein